MKKYSTHEDYLKETLKDPREAALYLNAAAEEKDPTLLLVALGQVTKAHEVVTTFSPLSRLKPLKKIIRDEKIKFRRK
ncbi:MAG TPA: hypothetical protein DF383_07625 [Deltaproteobacteria bacterium]|nr:hypothetical protein [Deltaproteobacteria bacterium]